MQLTCKDMDLDQIYASGQCFSWRPSSAGGYEIPAFGRVVTVCQQGTRFKFSCTETEFDAVWRAYFDLDTDYGAIKQRVDPADDYLRAAVAYGAGMRILRQDIWEIIVSFIISQNNNIPRIRKNIKDLCAAVNSGAFPTQQEILALGEPRLRALGLGYRAGYLCAAAAHFTAENGMAPQHLAAMGYQEAHAALRTCKGIGPKVADCICLFGLHHVDAFPVDTHVKQILKAHYPNGFPFARYKGCAGILQQYMFYYDLRKEPT